MLVSPKDEIRAALKKSKLQPTKMEDELESLQQKVKDLESKLTTNQDRPDNYLGLGKELSNEPESYYANAYAVASQGPGQID